MLPIFSDVVKPLNSCFSRVRLVRMVQRFCGEENVGGRGRFLNGRILAAEEETTSRSPSAMAGVVGEILAIRMPPVLTIVTLTPDDWISKMSQLF